MDGTAEGRGGKTALTRSLDHLAHHRRMIVSRAVAAGVLGAMPVPLLDDWLQAVVRRGTIRKLAEARRVDLDDESVRAIADGVVPPPSWKTILGGRAFAGLLRRTMRKVFLVFTLAGSAEAVTRSFAVATLFDHYCTRLHVGAGLDAAAGKELRAHIDGAIKATRGRLAIRLVQRGLVTSAKAAFRVPMELVDLASGGLLKRMLRGGKDEAAAEEVVESAVTRAAGSSFLARATAAVEAQLTLAGQGYLTDLVAAFEHRASERTR